MAMQRLIIRLMMITICTPENGATKAEWLKPEFNRLQSNYSICTVFRPKLYTESCTFVRLVCCTLHVWLYYISLCCCCCCCCSFSIVLVVAKFFSYTNTAKHAQTLTFVCTKTKHTDKRMHAYKHMPGNWDKCNANTFESKKGKDKETHTENEEEISNCSLCSGCAAASWNWKCVLFVYANVRKYTAYLIHSTHKHIPIERNQKVDERVRARKIQERHWLDSALLRLMVGWMVHSLVMRLAWCAWYLVNSLFLSLSR